MPTPLHPQTDVDISVMPHFRFAYLQIGLTAIQRRDAGE